MKTNHLVALVFILAAADVDALTVYFDDANRGPSATLEVQGIVASHSYREGPPQGTAPFVTTLGTGLGCAGGIGPDSELNLSMHFPVGSLFSDTQNGEKLLNLDVPGVIERILLTPKCRIYDSSGNLLTDTSPFLIVAHVPGSDGSRQFVQLHPDLPQSGVIDFTYSLDGPPTTTSIDIQLIGDESSEWHFVNYRNQHLDEEQTIEIGFSVVGVDFDPVPEPGMLALTGMGAVVLLVARRR